MMSQHAMFLAGFKRPWIGVGDTLARNVDGVRMMPRDRRSREIFSDVETFRLFALGLPSLWEDASRTTVHNGDPSTSAFASSFLARSQRDPIYRSCKRSRLRPLRPDFHRIPVHLFRDQAARTVESRHRLPRGQVTGLGTTR